MANNTTGKTAFVFAGGGSFGAIQVGMLRGLVAYGLRPDFVVGSSVGAINCAYFAGDPTAAGVARLENIWTGLKRREVFPVTWGHIAGFFSHTASLVESDGLRQLIERHLPCRELDKAVIPVHIVATELMSGASVLLSSGCSGCDPRQLRDPGGVPADTCRPTLSYRRCHREQYTDHDGSGFGSNHADRASHRICVFIGGAARQHHCQCVARAKHAYRSSIDS